MLPSGKAPLPDAIPAKIYKDGGVKRKGNRQDCNNHSGISLFSITGKILARLLFKHLIDHLK